MSEVRYCYHEFVQMLYLGANSYDLAMRLFRYCEPGAATLGNTYSVSILDQVTCASATSVTTIRDTFYQINFGDQCYTPPGLCVETHIYRGSISFLANNPNGYMSTWSLCCRNTILNVTANNLGLYTKFPDPALAGGNSTPLFVDYPTDGYFCIGFDKQIDFSCTDAFQKHIIQLCMPDLKVESYFILADKSKKSTINGLNQLIRLPKKGSERKDIEVLISPETAKKTSVLTEVNVSDIVEEILSNQQEYNESLTFTKALKLFEETIQNNTFPNWSTHFSSCKNCEFKTNSEQEKSGKLSGFKHCFKTMHKLSDIELDSPNIFEIWNFRGEKFLKKDQILLQTLKKVILNLKKTQNSLRQMTEGGFKLKKPCQMI